MRKSAVMYTDWVNNFLTVEKFAEHYKISVFTAQRIISLYRFRIAKAKAAPLPSRCAFRFVAID